MYVYTKHALEKIDAYGFEKDEVESVLRKGAKWKEEGRGIWHANMGGIEVVFAKSDQEIVIITIYAARWEK